MEYPTSISYKFKHNLYIQIAPCAVKHYFLPIERARRIINNIYAQHTQ